MQLSSGASLSTETSATARSQSFVDAQRRLSGQQSDLAGKQECSTVEQSSQSADLYLWIRELSELLVERPAMSASVSAEKSQSIDHARQHPFIGVNWETTRQNILSLHVDRCLLFLHTLLVVISLFVFVSLFYLSTEKDFIIKNRRDEERPTETEYAFALLSIENISIYTYLAACPFDAIRGWMSHQHRKEAMNNQWTVWQIISHDDYINEDISRCEWLSCMLICSSHGNIELCRCGFGRNLSLLNKGTHHPIQERTPFTRTRCEVPWQMDSSPVESTGWFFRISGYLIDFSVRPKDMFVESQLKNGSTNLGGLTNGILQSKTSNTSNVLFDHINETTDHTTSTRRRWNHQARKYEIERQSLSRCSLNNAREQF